MRILFSCELLTNNIFHVIKHSRKELENMQLLKLNNSITELHPHTLLKIGGKPENWKDAKTRHKLLQAELDDLQKKGITSFFQVCPHHSVTVVAPQSNPQSETFTKPLSCDGVILSTGQCAYILSGDCPTLILSGINKWGKRTVFMIHCSRENLIVGMNISILSNLKAYTEMYKEDLHAYMVLGISGTQFIHDRNDSIYGEKNSKLHKKIKHIPHASSNNGGINLIAIIKHQLKAFDMPQEHILHDGINTYGDNGFWSHREYVEKHENDSSLIDGRNIVLVANLPQ